MKSLKSLIWYLFLAALVIVVFDLDRSPVLSAGAIVPGTPQLKPPPPPAPPLATFLSEHCAPVLLVESMLDAGGYRYIDRFELFETWETPYGDLFEVGRLDDSLCLLWYLEGLAI